MTNEKEPGPNDVIDPDNYIRVRVRRSDGKLHASRENGDRIAQALRGLTFEELQEVATENDLEERFAEHVKNGRSHGLVRMFFGNMLRFKIKNKEKVTVYGKRIKTL